MSEDLTRLPPEEFLRLAVSRGGLELGEVSESLSPRAARALAWIAQSEDLTTASSRSRAVRKGSSSPGPEVYRTIEPSPITCPSCGRAARTGNRYCTGCGRELQGDTTPITMEDLVQDGHLTPQEADEALAAILLHQSEYTAGTRYSIFA
jgi:hypothetical protein